jgi:plastocyanin
MARLTPPRFVPVVAALVIAGGVWLTATAAPGLGRIEGAVRLTIPTRAALASGGYAPRTVSRPAPHPGTVSDVVVFIRDLPGAKNLPVTRTRMIQQDESFEPRVIAITRGSTVEFPNADPFFHNVFSLSSGAAFDLGRYKRGDTRSRVFTRPGLVKVYCHVHSQMSASILVLDNTYFTRPQADGTFDMSDVPPGSYRLSAWQERLGETQVSIQVQPGQTTQVEINLPLGSS